MKLAEGKRLKRAVLFGIVSILVNSVSAQVIGFGNCPDVKVVRNFDLTSYLGQWYEYAKYPNFFEIGSTCVIANYFYNKSVHGNGISEGNSNIRVPFYPVIVKNSAIREIINLKRNISTTGKARLENPSSDEAKLIVNINGIDANYWVLDTDYRTYSLVWSCTDFGIFNLKFLWILTRDRIPKQETVDHVYNEIEGQKISKGRLSKTKQSQCYN